MVLNAIHMMIIAKKQDCGWNGINEQTCLDRGCCWVPAREQNVPWCFKPVEPTEEDGNRYVPLEEKVDCGYYGIMAKECEKTRGCMWYPLDENSKEPWCYFAKENPKCHIKPDEKKQCGYKLITQEECEKRGCCYQELEGREQDIWCYESTEGRNPDIKYKEEETCAVYDKDKEDCGHYGITQDQCKEKGCCWEESPVKGVAWCFHKGKREVVDTPEEPEPAPQEEEPVAPQEEPVTPQEEEPVVPQEEPVVPTQEQPLNDEQPQVEVQLDEPQTFNNENDITVKPNDETQ
jgi:hypothetical protein